MFRGKSGFQHTTFPGGTSGTKISGTKWFNIIANANGKPIVFAPVRVKVTDPETHASTYYNIGAGVITFERKIVDSKPRYYGRVAINYTDDLSVLVEDNGITLTITHPTEDLEADFEGLEARVTALEEAQEGGN